MSDDTAYSFADAVQRLGRRDPLLQWIDLTGQQCSHGQMCQLADCLLANPNVVEAVLLGSTALSDDVGVKLAGFLAASASLRALVLPNNRLGETTYMAMAWALRSNTSLRSLNLPGNRPVESARVDDAFVQAIRLNPARPVDSIWCLYSNDLDHFGADYRRLKWQAEQQGHPPMLALLMLSVN